MSYGQNLQVFNCKRFKDVEKDILKTRKKLEEMRLEEESQNTRLLKVQQEERLVDNEYKDRRKKMEDTQEVLGFEAQKFNDEQKRENQKLERDKDSIIMLNDRKKKQEDDRFLREERQTKAKEAERTQALSEQVKLKDEVQELEQQIQMHRQYETFFKKVLTLSKDFQSEQTEDGNAITNLIDRYHTLKKKGDELRSNRERQEKIKDENTSLINNLKTELEIEQYQFTLDYNKLKLEIQTINAANHQKQTEIDSKLSQNNAIQAEFAQVIICIKNLISTIKITNEKLKGKEGEIILSEDQQIDGKDVEDKLIFIREEIKNLNLIKHEYQKYCVENGKPLGNQIDQV